MVDMLDGDMYGGSEVPERLPVEAHSRAVAGGAGATAAVAGGAGAGVAVAVAGGAGVAVAVAVAGGAGVAVEVPPLAAVAHLGSAPVHHHHPWGVGGQACGQE